MCAFLLWLIVMLYFSTCFKILTSFTLGPTLVELFCHRRRVDIQSDVSPFNPVVYACHRDSHLIVPSRCIIFPAVSWPPLGRRPSGWITNALLWGAVGAILLMGDHHLILFLLDVCSAGCMFTRRLISSFLILSILVFSAAFLRHLISVVVNICLSLLVRIQFSLW